MKAVPVRDAVGMVLGHDVTEIIPDVFKGRAFRKGHVIQESDIEKLLNIGKENIFAFTMEEGIIHENEAAERISQAAAGPGIMLSEPSEGKVNLLAEYPGLLKVNVNALYRINSIEEIVFSTLHTNQKITTKKPVAGTRIIPLTTREGNIEQVETVCSENYPIVEIKPFKSFKVGMITTGSEIYNGRIEDKFGPILHVKFADLGSRVIRQEFVSDDVTMTVNAIHKLIDDGAELIAVTGGMSVDPDDQTPASIKAAGADVVTYGSPIFPGAMFMLAYINDVPVLGLPGCVMYYNASIFDLTVPRILAGERVSKEDIIAMGHGGFCANCSPCRYPVCGFGKGV